MVKQLNVRIPDITYQQFTEYVQAKNLTQTQAIILAIDHLVRAELEEEVRQLRNEVEELRAQVEKFLQSR
jgi:hypothetical protein